MSRYESITATVVVFLLRKIKLFFSSKRQRCVCTLRRFLFLHSFRFSHIISYIVILH